MTAFKQSTACVGQQQPLNGGVEHGVVMGDENNLQR